MPYSCIETVMKHYRRRADGSYESTVTHRDTDLNYIDFSMLDWRPVAYVPDKAREILELAKEAIS